MLLPKNNLIAGVVGANGIGYVHLMQMIKSDYIDEIYLLGKNYSKTIDICKKFNKEFDIFIKPIKSALTMSKVVDFVSICTPNETHLELCEIFLKNDCYVLVEKPLFWEKKLSHLKVKEKCLNIFGIADGRLTVNYPISFLYKDIMTEVDFENIKDFSFYYQTRGNKVGNEIAVDLLPHAFSLLLKFVEVSKIKIEKILKTENRWQIKFLFGETKCNFNFVQDPKAINSNLSFIINSKKFYRKEIINGSERDVFLGFENGSIKSKKIINPMHSSINKAIEFCYKEKSNKQEPKFTYDIMTLISSLVNV